MYERTYDTDWDIAPDPVRRPKTIRCCNRALTLWSIGANECPKCGTEYGPDGSPLVLGGF